MKRPLTLESLENRDCPAVTLSLSAGSLTITGNPTGNLSVLGTATPQRFTIVDGAKTFGTYTITGNLNINLTSRPGFVRVDLAGNTLIGSVAINLGNGYTGSPSATPELRAVDVYDSTAIGAIAAGTVRGSVSVINGDGNERVGVGFLDAAGGSVDNPLTVRGGVTVTGRPSTPFSDTFQLGEGTFVGGDANVSHYDNVNFGSQVNTTSTITTVRGNVTVTTGSSTSNLAGGGLFANFQGTFNKNVTVNAYASTSTTNSISFVPPDVNVNTTIDGNVSVLARQALVQNRLVMLHDQAGSGTVFVAGTTNFTSTNNLGSLPTLIDLQGLYAKTVTINLANGGLSNQSSDFSFGPTGQINGDLIFTAGNGTNNFGTIGAGFTNNVFSGTMLGNLTVTMGNGDNYVDLQTGINGFLFKYLGGNAQSNHVSLSPLVATDFNVDLTFGSISNELTLNPNVTIFGMASSQPGANNTYNPNGADDSNFSWPF